MGGTDKSAQGAAYMRYAVGCWSLSPGCSTVTGVVSSALDLASHSKKLSEQVAFADGSGPTSGSATIAFAGGQQSARNTQAMHCSLQERPPLPPQPRQLCNVWTAHKPVAAHPRWNLASRDLLCPHLSAAGCE